jgi:UDP-N-acetylmuramate: L-alanyl-gamma-D-glutamyl-meso-diaminopimelate ligase
MPLLPKEAVLKGFGKEELSVINDRSSLENWLREQSFENAVVLFMSSGNYDGLDTMAFARQITT